MDVRTHARVAELLGEAEKAVRLKESLAPADRSSVDEALATIYRDLGAMVHQLLREPVVPPMIPQDTETDLAAIDEEPPGFTNEIEDVTEDNDRQSWYTDEIDLEGDPGAPMFSVGELSDVNADDEPTLKTDEVTLEEVMGKVVAGAAPVRLGQLRSPSLDEAPPWETSLIDLLELLALPSDYGDGRELAVEASRIQWASSGVDTRWSPFPANVQQILLGLVAARARTLQDALEVDIGPRVALDRLRRFQTASGLGTVAALDPNSNPETGSWQADVNAWWDLLTAGVER